MRAPVHVPLPQSDVTTEAFWAACMQRRLVIQHCRACGAFQHPPRHVCRQCRSSRFEWHESTGRGRVYTYTVVHHPASSDLRDDLPYIVVVAKLEDCGRVLVTSNLVGDTAINVGIDDPVRLRWDDGAGVWLPRFELIADM